MKKTAKPADTEPASPADTLRAFCPQIEAMTETVANIHTDIQSDRELVPAAEVAAVQEAADRVREAKRSLVRARSELSSAQADCQRLAQQNASDDELQAANATVDEKSNRVRIAHQRYQAALEHQSKAAGRAVAAGLSPSEEKHVRYYAIIRECMGRTDILKDAPTLREHLDELLAYLGKLAFACQFVMQDPGGVRNEAVRKQVAKLCEPELRIERPISAEQEYANKLDAGHRLVAV